MEAVILAGGKGTRLFPYTEDTPKPLVTVGDRPIIEILLRQLRRGGARRAHIAVGHLAHQIQELLGDGSRLGIEIVYSIEDKPLSTVGPLKLIKDLPQDFLVANGDILTDIDPATLYEHHRKTGAKVTVATYRRFDRIDYGVLDVSPEGWVTDFREKPRYDFTVSMGVYVFSRSVLDHVPAGVKFGFDDLMLKLLEEGEPISSFIHSGYWMDIGRPDDYAAANRDVERIKNLDR
jgi:NDP-sugar pyrophosphorylase family protein